MRLLNFLVHVERTMGLHRSVQFYNDRAIFGGHEARDK